VVVTKQMIREWLERARDAGATHLVVRSDSFSHEYYPVPCFSKEHAREKATRVGKMQSTREVYDLSEDWDEQLDQKRTWSV